MPSPAFTFGFIIATLMGAAFHLIVGGDIRRLALYLLAGWAGFALGHVVGVLVDINTFNVGTVRMFPALMGGIIALVAAFGLSRGRTTRRAVRR